MSATVDLGISGLEVRTGDHICAFYRGAERDDILVPFLEAGLRTGDKCICVLDTARPESLPALLDDPQVQERLERRQLELVDFESSYLASGRFVPDRMLEFWEHNIQSALEGGEYRMVRSAGETHWALGTCQASTSWSPTNPSSTALFLGTRRSSCASTRSSGSAES
jgi:hypothetical protein